MRSTVSFETPTHPDTRAIMPLPDVIPVRRTEEEAGYVSIRPVVRQNFPLHDLLGMVLAVTGKHPERIRQILRSGGVSFHGYRYSWDGFPVEESELITLLLPFPDADPDRAFRSDSCVAVILEAGSPPRPIVELERSTLARRRLLRRRSVWDALLAAASSGPLTYAGYSYQWRGDLYSLDLSDQQAAALATEARSLAPRDLRRGLRALDRAETLVFVCARERA